MFLSVNIMLVESQALQRVYKNKHSIIAKNISVSDQQVEHNSSLRLEEDCCYCVEDRDGRQFLSSNAESFLISFWRHSHVFLYVVVQSVSLFFHPQL